MRYEAVLQQLSPTVSLHRVLFILLSFSAGLRFNSCTNTITFEAKAPELTCADNETTDARELSTPAGWCSSEECDRWRYTRETAESIVQEWNLCDDQFKVLLLQTFLIVGFGVGGYFSAMLTDRFGRIRVFLVAAVLDCVIILLKSFSVNYWMYAVCCGLSQVIMCGMAISYYAYMNEIIYPTQRIYFECVVNFSITLDQCVLALSAYLARSWRNLERLQVIYSILNIILIAVVFRESPKWLLVTGQSRTALKSMRKMATKSARSKLSDSFLDNIEISKEVKSARVRDLASSKQLLINLTSGILVATMTFMVFCIITWNSGIFLSGSLYLNVCIMGLVDIPFCFLYVLLVRRVAKKWLMMSVLILCGTSLSMGALFKDFLPTIPAINKSFIFTARLAASFANNLQYSLLPEIFPTSLRGNGIGVTCLCARLLSAPMPYILMTANRNNVLLPSLSMAAAVVLSAFSMIPLPNTFRCRLPDTVDESRHFKRGSEHLFQVALIGGRGDEKAGKTEMETSTRFPGSNKEILVNWR